MLKNKTIIYLILLICLVSLAFANQPTLLSLQGKLVNTSTGAKIISADLRVNITDFNDNLVFNHSFSNAVSNGMFDLLLGSVYYLNLSYNEDYNLSIYVGSSDTPVGGPYWFRGGQGQIGAGDIASTESYTFSNVSVTGNFSIDSNMSVDSGTFFVDAENNFVGVGETSPGVEFEVEGGVNISGGLNVTAGNVLLATSSGYVGIGTAGPGSLLEIWGDNTNALADVGTQANYHLHLFGSPNDNSGIGMSFGRGNNIGAAIIAKDVGAQQISDLLFYTKTSTTASVDPTVKMVIATAGNVGIGTTSPSAKLQVIGNISVPGTLFVDNESGRVAIGATSPNVTFHVSGSANITGTLSVGSFEMSNAGAGTMNVSGQTTLATTAGNVGIGNENPNVTLDVSGDANITGYLEVGSGLNVSNGMNVLTGRVGIGTASPGAKLEISTGATGTKGLTIRGIAGGTVDLFEVINVAGVTVLRINQNGDMYTDNIYPNNDIIFQGGNRIETSANADLTIDPNGVGNIIMVPDSTDGNVGIGTTSPATTLDVQGKLNVTGNTSIAQDTLFVDNTSGNVGIGYTGYSGQKLAVNGAFRVEGRTTIGTDMDAYGASYFYGSKTHFQEKVGIGTTSPTYKLEVAGNMSVTGFVNMSANVSLGSGVLFVDNTSGNVGIGTTGSVASQKLEVYGDMLLGTGDSDTETYLNFDGGNEGLFWDDDGTVTNFGSDSGGTFVLQDGIVIRGNVGIGNTLPNNTLDVSGDANISGKLYAESANITATIQAATFIGDGSKLTGISTGQIWNSSGANVFLNDSTAKVGIGTSSPSERLVVIGNISVPGTLFVDNESNRVGIGNTLPNNTLDVSGDANISGKLYAESANITTTIQAATFIGDGSKLTGISTGQIWNSSGATAFLNDSTASVGIGTASPAEKLVVRGNFSVRNTSNDDNVYLFVDNTSGNVGIGTTAPTHKLHVIGDGNFSGDLYVMGNISTFGADFAEMFESDEELEPGDVVCLEKDFIVARCSQRADPLVMGVVSPDPTITGNNQLDDAYPIGVVGIVSTKVKGPLDKGNLLTTSSLEGYAEKATIEDFGAIIGKAMDSCEEERCKINVLVGLR